MKWRKRGERIRNSGKEFATIRYACIRSGGFLNNQNSSEKWLSEGLFSFFSFILISYIVNVYITLSVFCSLHIESSTWQCSCAHNQSGTGTSNSVDVIDLIFHEYPLFTSFLSTNVLVPGIFKDSSIFSLSDKLKALPCWESYLSLATLIGLGKPRRTFPPQPFTV